MIYKSLEDIFDSFNQLRVLIVGDVMLDRYVYGKVNRISPEAPVPIVQVNTREKRLGGAANVALNVQSLGATPILCSIIGSDAGGTSFIEQLSQSGISSEGIIQSDARETTVKERIMAGSQQIIRIDSETEADLTVTEEKKLLLRIGQLIKHVNVVIFEDYDKGTLNKKVIRETIKMAQEVGVPTVVDPKKKNFFCYKNVSLFKPNLKELKEGLKVEFNSDDHPSLVKAVNQLKNRLNLAGAMVTLSERGVYIDREQEKHLLPAHVRLISDVSGAGDTVISITALCYALNLSPRLTASLANLGGGLVCEYLGVVPVDKSRLYEEAVRHQIFNFA